MAPNPPEGQKTPGWVKFGLAVAVLLFLGAMYWIGNVVMPRVAGGVYAVAGFPAYGAVCGKAAALFDGSVTATDYASFLMNRGCDAATAAPVNRCSDYYPTSWLPGSNVDLLERNGLSREVMTFHWPSCTMPPNPLGPAPPPEDMTDAFLSTAGVFVVFLTSIAAMGPAFGGVLFLAYAALGALAANALWRYFTG